MVQMQPNENTLFPQLGYGLGLRSEHFRDILEGRSTVSWFEVVSENFMGEGGRPLYVLEKVRQEVPIALHGVSLSLGSVDPLSIEYLKLLKSLVDRFEPALVSDHCCWTGIDGENLHDLMPLPYTEEVLTHLVNRILQVQDYLGRRILVENVSSYLSYSHSEMTEWEFLTELSQRSDCGLLLDVNNVYVSSVNHQFSPMEFLNGIPMSRVGQIHLAGYSSFKNDQGQIYLIDTHDRTVCPEVWKLYEEVIKMTGPVTTLVEWDSKIPDYSVLEEEINHAKKIEKKITEALNVKTHALANSARLSRCSPNL
jgi:uncharacterized protein (UPF0276 family)